MKNFLLIAGLLVGLIVVYVFVVEPLLKPVKPPPDPLGDALNQGVGLAGDVLSAPGKVLSTLGKQAKGFLHFFGGGGGTQSGGFGKAVIGGGGAPYAVDKGLTADQLAANKAISDKYGSMTIYNQLQKAGAVKMVANFSFPPVHA